VEQEKKEEEKKGRGEEEKGVLTSQKVFSPSVATFLVELAGKFLPP
jgi:hypothetical protein